MSFSIISEKLRQLKLIGMLKAFETHQHTTLYDGMAFEERLGLMLTEEINFKENKRLARLLKSAKLKYPNACYEEIDFSPKRGIDRQLIANLSTCNWINNNHNLFLTGATGCGKTWLASAFGNLAARNGFSVIYKRVPTLFESLEIAHADGSLPRVRLQLSKCDVLILDDWGLTPLNQTARHDLLEIIEHRLHHGAIIITSQLPIKEWHSYIGDPTIADAILDRIIHKSHQLNLKGESLRKILNDKN